MQTFIYIIWFLLPAFFFVMALYAALERMSTKERKHNPGELSRQGVFVLVCVLISVGIDQYILPSVVKELAPDFLPKLFYEIVLLPFVLLIGAKLFGGAPDIQIGKAPNPSQRKRK